MRAALLAIALVLAASPAELQLRYDRARDVVETSHNTRAVAEARAEIAAVERADGRPKRSFHPHALPSTWRRARGELRRDGPLSARLGRLGARFDGWAGFWVHDVSTGRYASWNADASFPGASTVKLGVVAAALRAAGARPERSHDWYDLQQLTAWSSNLAANRLVARLGYARVWSAMRRLGMRSSTYPGPYRAGTSSWLSATRSRGDAPNPPPHGHVRVTTAHDLGRALYSLQAAAVGNRYRQRLTGLSRRKARLALHLLRHSIPSGNNAGLLRPWLGSAAVVEKNGWLDDTRITAAIVYRSQGPLIVVVEAYRPDLEGRAARALGREVLQTLALVAE